MSGYVSYRFGAGRYVQEDGLLDVAGQEIGRYGSRAYVLAGPRALAATQGRLLASMESAGVSHVLDVYPGHPSDSKAGLARAALADQGCDVVVAVGGGKIMDLAKAVAYPGRKPIVAVPTSAATCACFSPLSVMYTDEGAFSAYRHYDYELDAVLVDDAVMSRQPPRLLAAGIMDAMAKYIEIPNGKPRLTLANDGVDRYSAFCLAKLVYDLLREHGRQAYEDVCAGHPTRRLHDVVYSCIALTGLVSSMMRAHGQTAVAHRLYELLRTHYPAESGPFLHGEIVATGLVAQLGFNGKEDAVDELREFMALMGMPPNLRALGLDGSQATLDFICQQIADTESVPDDDESRRRLRSAFELIR